jgi:membrane protease YdiL (CAAX protease family)
MHTTAETSDTGAVAFPEKLDAIRWRPTIETALAFGSYILVVGGMVLAFRIFTVEQVALNFITFGLVTLVCLGVALPVLYTRFVRHLPLSELGITRHLLIPSLILGLLLGLDTFRATLATLNITWTADVVPVALMALSVGLFEAIFFRGWLQLRFESAFGLVPGLILGALAYSLYHIGYGMDLDEMAFLFGLGLIFSGMFRLTRNIAVLWPFYTPVGGLYENLRSGLTMPFEATYGFIIVLALMIGMILFAATWQRDRVERAKRSVLLHEPRT